MIQVRLRKAFSAFSLDLEFQAGAGITILFGPSGAGKTLVLESIAGFARPDEGRILLDDDILFDGATGVHLPPQARDCGYVFQKGALFPHMTLRENLQFAAERRPRLERHRRVNEMIERFRLTESAGRRPHEVSGGQRQRLSIARALIGGPRLLLLDEPSQGLDAPLRDELYEALRQVRSEFKTPVLMVTHDLEECFELADQMIVVRAGRIVQSGTPRTILDQPANLDVARLLGTFNLIAGEIRMLDPGRNLSRVKIGEHELEGPYFPGHLKGDRVTFCIRPDQLTVRPRNSRPAQNQMPATLERTVEQPFGVRLEFAGSIAVTMGRGDFERLRQTTDRNQDQSEEWIIEFPAASLRVL
jgi:ABC-type Fe3+/spermidine/putrescine transport system ATPase subunit